MYINIFRHLNSFKLVVDSGRVGKLHKLLLQLNNVYCQYIKYIDINQLSASGVSTF